MSDQRPESLVVQSLEGLAPEGLPPPPPAAKSWRRRQWLRIPLVAVAVLGGLVVAGLLVDKALPHELINVDFSEGVEPFSVAQNSFGIAEHVGGTYRLTDNKADGPFVSVGGFARTRTG